MSKARQIADIVSAGSALADGTISVTEVSGAAPLASPTFTGTATAPQINLVNPNNTGKVLVLDVDQGDVITVGDLEIYDDRTSGIGYMLRTDTSTQSIGAETVVITDKTGQKGLANFTHSGGTGTATLRYHDSNGGYDKLSTSLAGISVVGTVTADYLNITAADNAITAKLANTDGANYLQVTNGTANGYFGTTATDTVTMLSIGAHPITFGTDGGVERMRISSDGSVLVGTTDGVIWNEAATDNTKEGVVIEPKSLQISRFQDTQALFNRQGSDGKSLLFAKDGAELGSISVAGNLNIGSGGTRIWFRDATKCLRPVSNEAGSGSDGIINIGEVGGRFKDLYLSGGAYLGGTGAANHLSDYEEGVWLPSVEFSSAGSTATTASGPYTTGSYTKVGDIVTVEFNISSIVFGNGTGYLRMSLPFTHVGITAYPGKNQASSGYTVAAETASGYSGVLKAYGVGPLNLMYDGGTSWAFITNSNASTISPNSINGQFTYHTNQ